MLDVAVFTALGSERRAATEVLGASRQTGSGIWRGRLGDGGSCAVVQTGIGPARAQAAAAAIEPARVFVACGCAGALANGLRASDLVAAGSVLALDDGRGVSERLPAGADPLAAWAHSRGIDLHVGPFASVPAVLESARAKREAGAHGAVVVEMECAAIAAGARARGIPFVGIRVVLDVQGQGVPALGAIDEMTGEMRIGRAVAQLAVRPWLWPAVGRLARQTRIADERLRTVLAALFAAGMSALVGEPPVVSAIG